MDFEITVENTFYGVLFEENEYEARNNSELRLTALRYFSEPVTYRCNIDSLLNIELKHYELLFDKTIGMDIKGLNDSRITYKDYSKMYAALWWGIVALSNGTFNSSENEFKKHFQIIGDDITKSGLISFNFSEDAFTGDGFVGRYYIYTTLEGLENYYEFPENYYIFYDEKGIRNDIEHGDVYELMNKFVKKFGIKNMYKGVTLYVYEGPAGYIDENGMEAVQDYIHQDFFIFYTRNEPDDELKRHILREKVIIDKGGRDLAKFYYPNLFDDIVRRIYSLYSNNAHPVSYNLINDFLAEHGDFINPEIITIFPRKIPLIVDGGINNESGIIYHPYIIENPQCEEEDISNKFLHYLSSAVNYVEGTKDKILFPSEINFEDHLDDAYGGGYVQFKYQAVTWRIYRV